MLRRSLQSLLLSIILLPHNVLAQSIGFEQFGSEDEIAIPFTLHNGYLIVTIQIDGVFELPFIFDTGAQHTLLFDKLITDILGYDYPQKVKIYGADLTGERYASICRQVGIRVAGAQPCKRDLVVLDDHISILNNKAGTPIHGVLGADYFRHLSVQIDYIAKRIILRKPQVYQPGIEDYTRIPMIMQDNKPHIVITTSSKGDEKTVLLDTGVPWPLVLLHNDSSTTIRTPGLLDGKMARGLGGDIVGYASTMDHLVFGPYTFEAVPTRHQVVDSSIYLHLDVLREGLIGNEVLSQFDMVIDYPQHTLWLKPNKNYGKPMRRDRSGLRLYAYGDQLNKYIVEQVVMGSPADDSGLLPGDIIRKVGWWSSKWYSLSSLNRKLSRAPEKKVTLHILRKGTKLRKTIILKDY